LVTIENKGVFRDNYSTIRRVPKERFNYYNASDI
jgi:hypothetical protein